MSVRPKGSTRAGLMKTPFKRQIRQVLLLANLMLQLARRR